jgi:hypothetical protein
MARIVTGSVALSVEPNMRHSMMLKWRDSMPRIDQMYTRTLRRGEWIPFCASGSARDTYPRPTADIKVPRNAKREDRTKIAEKVVLLGSVSYLLPTENVLAWRSS